MPANDDWTPIDPETAKAVPDYDRATHPLAGMPPSEKLHITLQILQAMPYADLDPRTGNPRSFSDRGVADLAGVSESFVRARRAEALAQLSQFRDLLEPLLT